MHPITTGNAAFWNARSQIFELLIKLLIKSSASALFLQMGQTFGVGHNHFDVGSFQWFRSGAYLVGLVQNHDRAVQKREY